MAHHYGEDAVTVNVSDTTFTIVLGNHVTGAQITITGPVQGVFETRRKVMNRARAQELGQALAHFIRDVLK